MDKEIIRLRGEGLSLREVAEQLNISLGKVQREINKTDTKQTDTVKVSPMDNTDTADTDRYTDTPTDTADTDRYTDTPTDTDDYNKKGVKKLRKEDYTKEELKINPSAPYYD